MDSRDDKSITQETIRKFLNYDSDTGGFLWAHPGRYKTNPPGYVEKLGYLRITINGRRFLAHRLAWLHYYGEWPNGLIDHIDGNPKNNAIKNLRVGTLKINAQNRRRGQGRVGLLGVHEVIRKDRTMFRASIRCDNKLTHLGYYQSPEEAHSAYLVAKNAMHAGSTLVSPADSPKYNPRLSETGVKNIYKNKKGFQVKMKVDKRQVCLGTYKTKEQAIDVLNQYNNQRAI